MGNRDSFWVWAGTSGMFEGWCGESFFLKRASVRAHAQLFRQTTELPGHPTELLERPSKLPGLPSESLSRPAELPGRQSELSSRPSEPFGRLSEVSGLQSELPGRPSELLRRAKIGQKHRICPIFHKFPSPTFNHSSHLVAPKQRWTKELRRGEGNNQQLTTNH